MHGYIKALISLVSLTLSYKIGDAVTKQSAQYTIGKELIEELSQCERELPRDQYCTWNTVPDTELNDQILLLGAPKSSPESI